MSRKHFVELAKNIARIDDDYARRMACVAVIDACLEFNNKFDIDKFRAACGVK